MKVSFLGVSSPGLAIRHFNKGEDTHGTDSGHGELKGWQGRRVSMAQGASVCGDGASWAEVEKRGLSWEDSVGRAGSFPAN